MGEEIQYFRPSTQEFEVMLELDDLEELFDDLGFDEPTDDQLTQLLGIFQKDFVDEAFTINACSVKIVDKASFNREFKGCPETFVHLITRESKMKGQRMFDRERANRLHWIKPILVNYQDPRIKYYEYLDEKGIAKKHFWFEEFNFMVVLKPIGNDLLVVTGFKVDALEKKRYLKRYRDYHGL